MEQDKGVMVQVNTVVYTRALRLIGCRGEKVWWAQEGDRELLEMETFNRKTNVRWEEGESNMDNWNSASTTDPTAPPNHSNLS